MGAAGLPWWGPKLSVAAGVPAVAERNIAFDRVEVWIEGTKLVAHPFECRADVGGDNLRHRGPIRAGPLRGSLRRPRVQFLEVVKLFGERPQ
jgi:hypothetical protein